MQTGGRDFRAGNFLLMRRVDRRQLTHDCILLYTVLVARHAFVQGRAQIAMAVHQVRLATSSQDGHECRADLGVWAIVG